MRKIDGRELLGLLSGYAIFFGIKNLLVLTGAIPQDSLTALFTDFNIANLMAVAIMLLLFVCWTIPLLKAVQHGFTLGYLCDVLIMMSCIAYGSYMQNVDYIIPLAAIAAGAILDIVNTRIKTARGEAGF